MQNLKRPGRSARSKQQRSDESASTSVSEGVEPAETEFDAYDTFEMYRVTCPDCAQPIALLADEDVLPEHALCATRWDPFGLTVCAGTGRAAADAEPADDSMEAQEQDTGLLLTLPQGLDWRTQPFSHVGGQGSRPRRIVPLPDRRSAA
ncbi:hypothetical protein [Streptomyces sp. NPDC046925]|uniref:hypothetical protein n=1 Tax=Streptomyces sp. NPDC046925 TaxID=3155375 RepID=UPI003407A0D8